jgi:hypothetical protein
MATTTTRMDTTRMDSTRMDSTNDGLDGLVNELSTMNLSAMADPDRCKVVWHYAELSIIPESFSNNIDWSQQIIRLKHGQTSVFMTFTYFTGFRRSMRLADIMELRSNVAGPAGLPRVETLKEWATSDMGLSMIFKDIAMKGMMTGNYLAVPILDNVNEIHMCVIGIILHKIGFMLRVAQTPTQRFTMFVDLADGFQNHLSITGTVLTTGVNIFKAVFELLKKRPITEYLDLITNLPPTPFIQMVYNIKAYFPELQVIWAVELTEKAKKQIMSVGTAPLDRMSHKFARMDQLEKLQAKWLARRENSILFKSMVGAIRSHSVSVKGKEPARFSAIWPEVVDVITA